MRHTPKFRKPLDDASSRDVGAGWWKSLNRGLSGVDVSLPDTYGLRNDDLCALLREAHDSYATVHGPSPADREIEAEAARVRQDRLPLVTAAVVGPASRCSPFERELGWARTGLIRVVSGVAAMAAARSQRTRIVMRMSGAWTVQRIL